MNSLKNLAMGGGFARVREHHLVRCDGEGHDGRRLLVELPGRALEDRRGGDQEGARERTAPNTSRPTRKASPTKQLTDVEDLISKGANVLIILAMDFGGDFAGGQEGERRRHPGHRL